jgi:hypothetical protein
MSEDDAKKMSTPQLIDKRSNFPVFWMRFQAFARVKEFHKGIAKTKNPELPETENGPFDADKTKKKTQEEAIELNAITVAYLTIALETSNKLMAIVHKSKSKDWPNGQAHLIINELFRKYAPDDMVSKVEMKRDLANLKFNIKDSPADWLEEIATIEIQYATFLSEEDKLALIMDKAPSDYHIAISAEQVRQSGNTTFDIDELEKAMTQLYRLKNPKNLKNSSDMDEDEVEEESEKSLAGITCYNCKKQGHFAHNCPEKLTGHGGNHFSGSCFYCGQRGHTSNDCWEKEENKEKRHPNWKSQMIPRNETGAAAVSACVPSPPNQNFKSDESVEYYLCGITGEYVDPLRSPDIFIADTAATTHSTAHIDGLINLHEPGDDAKMWANNGGMNHNKIMGNLPTECFDQYGNAIGKAVLCDVSYVPESLYNLFSLTKITW